MITVTMSATSNTAQAITIMSITFTPPSSLSAPGLVILEIKFSPDPEILPLPPA